VKLARRRGSRMFALFSFSVDYAAETGTPAHAFGVGTSAPVLMYIFVCLLAYFFPSSGYLPRNRLAFRSWWARDVPVRAEVGANLNVRFTILSFLS
jgi:hypothetical protein